jgi:N-acetylglucosaminyldiphosphoundecaprenol N-acetyl-beta-D-mannosaminyltransferase
VPLWAISPADAAATVVEHAQRRDRGFVAVANVYTTMLARERTEFLAAYRDAAMVVPDGMPLIWALNSLEAPEPRLRDRVFGPGLMLEVMDRGRALGLTHYLLGGTDGSSAELQSRLEARLPGVSIVGRYEPPFRPLTADEETALTRDLETKRPHVIWVGIGAPKQEALMHRLRDRLPGVAVGVGAAFDFHSGRVRQAPAWVGRAGLEWLFRLAMEPRRLWRRYFWSNPRFLALWGLSLCRGRGARR